MNRKLLGLQLAACGVFSLVLLVQWGYGRMSRNQLEQSLNNKSQADYQADMLPELNLLNRSAESYAAIVERPLFVEGRKPIAENANETVQATDNGQIDDWLLIGVYDKGKHNKPLALFRKQNEAKKFLKLTEEQSISGWSVEDIQPDRVILQQGGQQKTVMLRKPRPQTKTPVPPRPKLPVPANPAAAPAPAQPPVETSNNESD